MEALDALAWPVGRLGEAIMGLARLHGWQLRSPEAPVYPVGVAHDSPEALHGWLEAAAAWLGVEAEPVEVPYAAVESLVYGAGPALLRLPGREKPGFLALLGSTRRHAMLLGPDLVVHRVPVGVLCTACRHDVEAPLVAEVGHVLDAVGVPGRHRKRAPPRPAERAAQWHTSWRLLGLAPASGRLVLAADAADAPAPPPVRAARGVCRTVPLRDPGVGAAGARGIAGAPRSRLAAGMGAALRDGDPPPPVEHLGPGPLGARGRWVAEGALTGGCPAPRPRGDAPSGGGAVFWTGVGGRGG